MSPADQGAIQRELDAWKQYVEELHMASTRRISSVIRRTQSTPFGPGAYLARWQQLLDDTPITPCTAEGPVRHGSSKSVKKEARKEIDGGNSSSVVADEDPVGDKLPEAPSTDTIARLLWPRFAEILVSA
jgi:hypothetical protein